MGGTLALIAEPDIEQPIGDRLEPDAWDPVGSLGRFGNGGPHARGCMTKSAAEHDDMATRTALHLAESVRWDAGGRLGRDDRVMFFRTCDGDQRPRRAPVKPPS
ncbi:MAG: hypothetical protein OXQ90_02110 [Gammaproteobacteria bacterium]|nr:hypothetical protein [Gammaproteobacteria bacterium]